MRIYFCFIVIVFGIRIIDAQKVVEYVEVPRDIIFLVIANQPDCPIRFENARLLSRVEGGTSSSYELRNIGQKPIRSVTVASSTGAENTYDIPDGVRPGKIVPKGLPEKRPQEKVVPLTDELRQKLHFVPPMKAIFT